MRTECPVCTRGPHSCTSCILVSEFVLFFWPKYCDRTLDFTAEQLQWLAVFWGAMCCGRSNRKKGTTYICVPSWHSRGWCLLVWFGVCVCGLARALVLSIHSNLRSRSCACLWEALILSCNERSQQENKALFFQSSGSDESTLPIWPPFHSLLSKEWRMSTSTRPGRWGLPDTWVATISHVLRCKKRLPPRSLCVSRCYLMPPRTLFQGLMWWWNKSSLGMW